MGSILFVTCNYFLSGDFKIGLLPRYVLAVFSCREYIAPFSTIRQYAVSGCLHPQILTFWVGLLLYSHTNYLNYLLLISKICKSENNICHYFYERINHCSYYLRGDGREIKLLFTSITQCLHRLVATKLIRQNLHQLCMVCHIALGILPTPLSHLPAAVYNKAMLVI